MLNLSPLLENDAECWNLLIREYMAFYNTERTDTEYRTLWHRIVTGRDIHAVGARLDGALVGVAHYVYHASCWSADVCYLQDLYVAEPNRCQGIGRALIDHVAQQAALRQSPRLYWLTQSSNETARILYDKVAAHSGFIRYEKALS